MILLFFINNAYAYSQDCINKICAFPGQFLKYSYNFELLGESESGFITYAFGKFLEPNTIELFEIQESFGIHGEQTKYLLELTSGNYFENENWNQEKFTFIKKIPINVDNLQKEIFQSSSIIIEGNYKFKEFVRETITIKSFDGENQVTIDKNSGILLSLIVQTHENEMLYKIKFKLDETNFFQKNSNVQDNVNYENIPIWFKKITEWWLSEKISDEEFMNNLKFLIEKKIIVIDEEVTMLNLKNDYPAWFKNYAKKWYAGLLSDREFINSISRLS